MASKQPLKPTSTTNVRKRKSTDDLDALHPAKQSKIQSFFAPQVSLSATCGTDQTTSVAKLSHEQNTVLQMVVEEEKNVFFTGSAGTGKSLLLRAIISRLRRKHSGRPDYVAVTASTGMAASNIGGMTIHSWGAVTPGSNDIDSQIKCIRTCKPALHRWKSVKVLIIDEVSMLDGHLFDTLTKIADRLRKKTDKPFGGIQLVITGDFFQLPPVSKGDPFFAFESASWKQCIEHTVNLTKVFRQKDDQFVSILNQMRHGDLSPVACETFKSLSRPLPPPPPSMPNITPTELFPMRYEVSNSNATRLKALPHPLHTFYSHDTFPGLSDDRKPHSAASSNPGNRTGPVPASTTKPASSAPVSGSRKPREGLLGGVLAEKVLYLKKGAQVMLVKNVDEMLVNGCVGRVVGFYGYREVMDTVISEGEKRVGSTKTTGFIRNVKIGLDGALLRASESSSNKENAKSNAAEKKGSEEASKSVNTQKEDEKFPVVEFPTVDGGKEVVLVMREEFKVEDAEGKVLARRMQVPLILAWAMSIHKSQGQTIQRVKVDLGKVFEKGQSYVALSRAASMDGLQVLRFDPKKVMAHPKVVEWCKTLEVLETDKQEPSDQRPTSGPR